MLNRSFEHLSLAATWGGFLLLPLFSANAMATSQKSEKRDCHDENEKCPSTFLDRLSKLSKPLTVPHPDQVHGLAPGPADTTSAGLTPLRGPDKGTTTSEMNAKKAPASTAALLLSYFYNIAAVPPTKESSCPSAAAVADRDVVERDASAAEQLCKTTKFHAVVRSRLLPRSGFDVSGGGRLLTVTSCVDCGGLAKNYTGSQTCSVWERNFSLCGKGLFCGKGL